MKIRRWLVLIVFALSVVVLLNGCTMMALMYNAQVQNARAVRGVQLGNQGVGVAVDLNNFALPDTWQETLLTAVGIGADVVIGTWGYGKLTEDESKDQQVTYRFENIDQLTFQQGNDNRHGNNGP